MGSGGLALIAPHIRANLVAQLHLPKLGERTIRDFAHCLARYLQRAREVGLASEHPDSGLFRDFYG